MTSRLFFHRILFSGINGHARTDI